MADFAWFSKKQLKSVSVMQTVRVKGSDETHFATGISHDPTNSGTMWDDIVLVGEITRVVKYCVNTWTHPDYDDCIITETK